MQPALRRLVIACSLSSALMGSVRAVASTNAPNRNVAIRTDLSVASDYLRRGIEYCEKREWDKAIGALTEAIKLNPKEGLAYGWRGCASLEKRLFDKSIADFSEAIELDPTNQSAYLNRASAYRETGELPKAISDYDACLRLNRTNAIAYKGRAAIYNVKAAYDQALADWNEGLRLDPKDANALIGRGDCNSKLGRVASAIQDYHEAIQLEPQNDKAYNSMAWLYATSAEESVRNGRQAVQLATKACELTAWKDWHSTDTLAAAFAEIGDFANAIKYQAQALRLAGTSDDDRERMQRRLILYGQHQAYHQSQK